MKPTVPTYKKIGVVYGILIILLTFAFFIRWWQGNNLKKVQTEKIATSPALQENSYAGTLSLQSMKFSYKVGEKIAASVVFEAPDKQIDGADVILRFNPQIIKVSSVSAGPFFKLMPRKEMDNESGTAKITLLDPESSNPVKGKVIFAVLEFTAQAPGTTTLDFDFRKGSTSKTVLTEKGSSLNILGMVKGQTIEVLP